MAVSAAAPNRVYALIEALPNPGLYRSDNSGDTWQFVSNQSGLLNRPFYYTNLDADPTNADRLFAGAEGFYQSTDAGRTFRSVRTPHGDNHDLWINPRNPAIWIQANDGGANITLNDGQTWSSQYNQPTAEIYQVAVDNQYPYRVYGAQQDNSTLILPSLPPRVREPGRPDPALAPGPGVRDRPDHPPPGPCRHRVRQLQGPVQPDEPAVGAGEAVLGGRPVALRERGNRHDLPVPAGFTNGDLPARSRHALLRLAACTPHQGRRGHLGSHQPRPDGIRPDQAGALGHPDHPRRHRRGVLQHPVPDPRVPLEPGVIWTGANDGPIHVTRDGGKTWKKITPPALPGGGRVQTIEPSPHRRGSAYVAVLRYLLGDFRPWIFRTDDYGATWTLLTTGTNGIPADEPTRVVREDPDRAGLLYAGTEFGMFVSFDNGGRWQPFQLNLPRTPVTDIRVHRKDLVLSTQGRSFWILDNLSVLHQATPAVMSAPAHLFAPREDIRYRYSGGFGGAEGARAPAADQPEFPPMGASIEYWLASVPQGALTLEIRDSRGTLVRRFSSEGPGEVARDPIEPSMRRPVQEIDGTPRLPARPGVNRFIWDYRWPGAWAANPGASGRNGPMAVPGRYTVRLVMGSWNAEVPLVIRADPRITQDGVTQAVLEDQLAHNIQARDLVSDLNHLVDRVRSARQRAASAPTPDRAVVAGLEAVEGQLLTPPVRYSQPGLQAHITYLYGMDTRADQQVGKDSKDRLRVLRAELDRLIATVDRLTQAR